MTNIDSCDIEFKVGDCILDVVKDSNELPIMTFRVKTTFDVKIGHVKLKKISFEHSHRLSHIEVMSLIFKDEIEEFLNSKSIKI